MDFYRICTREIERGPRKGELELYPDYIVGRSKDLMIRGRSFYAIWDEEKGLWSQDEYDVQRLVDEDLDRYAEEQRKNYGLSYSIKYLRSFGSQSWTQFQKFVKNLSDSHHTLDNVLTFANTETKKSDYVSRRLPYALEQGSIDSYDELVGTLYPPDERLKFEWAIGAVISGDAKRIQKFLVFYGAPGTGKGTVLEIIMKLFPGYTTTFEAKALASANSNFATDVFRHHPLVAIQQDGDLSKIQDNTRLNSIISHEYMSMNEKFKDSYTDRVDAFLFMGTNQPVKISDAKSGIIRRLIDVNPSGISIPVNHYLTLVNQVDFELGAIAYHCLEVYRRLGKNYYSGYRPLEMMLHTDVFFNFIEAQYDIFKSQDSTSLKQAYALYKEYCSETGIDRILPQYKFREELKNYFDAFRERGVVDGAPIRHMYVGFNASKFKTESKIDKTFSLVIEETESLLDEMLAEQPAQYASGVGTPKQIWSEVRSTLSDIDTNVTHFVKVPEDHIVIHFDLKDADGRKSLERNLEEASKWPATYAELSKSGAGVHLHYIYEGDSGRLSPIFAEGVEIKVYRGNASLRRLLSKCNSVPVASLPEGSLPLKEKKVLTATQIQSEKGLRDMIARNLRKEIHPSTKSSIDFIKKILDECYENGMAYDVSDLKSPVLAFANNSTNQAMNCIKLVQQMRFQGHEAESAPAQEGAIVHFDVEVYPNLFVVCWMYDDEDDDEVVRMINPTPQEVEGLFQYRLIGYNNRRYDNHILYARYMGYDNQMLFKLSQRLIKNDPGATFGEAYNLSYTDIYDFSSVKQSLKMWQIVLGLRHKELDIPWDEPVPEILWDEIIDYCCNDVRSTKATFHARRQDFVARQILADLSGLTVNDSTAKHTSRIIFGKNRTPQSEFEYTHLENDFPGYEFDRGKSTYRGEVVGEGGYVYAEPGIYENVVELDIESMHPTSIEQLSLFGEYTPRFSALKAARLAIKHEDYETAEKMLGGALKPYLKSKDDAEALSYALKIVINIVYGLTSARFENTFKDPRNIDNIVAKRGALFMIDLKHAVQEQGYKVIHIKTDSIKIPDATEEIIEYVCKFGEKMGYVFEQEAIYKKLCLVNDAVYVARYAWHKKKKPGSWVAVGAQFQHPYVFKQLFSGEDIAFNDLCETKQVMKGALYLDHNHDQPPPRTPDDMQFIGRIGRFVPVEEGQGGGVLYRVVDDKLYAAPGTKNFLWMEAEYAQAQKDLRIDMNYFDKLVHAAIANIENYGYFGDFKE